MTQIVDSPENMEAAGASLIQTISAPTIIFLRGNLGAGKTTFVRGALRELGYDGLVKSPTFTLVESYTFTDFSIHHFDLYRISDPEELDFIGVREYSTDSTICFIEWPDMGLRMLPKPDIEVDIKYFDDCRQITLTDHRP